MFVGQARASVSSGRPREAHCVSCLGASYAMMTPTRPGVAHNRVQHPAPVHAESSNRREHPHAHTPLLQIDDGRLLNQLPVWAPEPAIRQQILVDNPARLYGF